MHINREQDETLSEWLDKLPAGEVEQQGDGLSALYFRVYPTHTGSELHWFLQGHGIGICLDEQDRERNRQGTEKAKAFLYRKIWEQQTGQSLA